MRILPTILAAVFSAGMAYAQIPPAPDAADPIAASADDDEEAAEERAPEQLPYERPVGPVVDEPAYDQAVRGRIGAAQARRGVMDGGWLIEDQNGAPLYTILFSDDGVRLEGAWRDMRRGGTASLGPLDLAERVGGGLRVRFRPQDAQAPVVLDLRPGDREWSGQMTQGALTQAVWAQRTAMAETWANYEPAGSASPYVAPGARRPGPPPRAKAAAVKRGKGRAVTKGGKAKGKAAVRGKKKRR